MLKYNPGRLGDAYRTRAVHPPPSRPICRDRSASLSRRCSLASSQCIQNNTRIIRRANRLASACPTALSSLDARTRSSHWHVIQCFCVQGFEAQAFTDELLSQATASINYQSAMQASARSWLASTRRGAWSVQHVHTRIPRLGPFTSHFPTYPRKPSKIFLNILF